jgi:hypothetical protein
MKGHDVPDNEPEISYSYPDTNRDTKPLKSAVTENEAPRKEGHKLPSNQPGKSSDTYIHPDRNTIANPTSTEHDKPTEEECEVPSNAEPAISSGTYVISNTNTKPAVNEKVPVEEHKLPSNQPGKPSDTYIHPDRNTIANPTLTEHDKPTEEECEVPSNAEPEISSGTHVIPCNTNSKPAVNEDEAPKDEGHEVLGTLEPETYSDKYIYPKINRNAKPAENEYDIPME